MFRGWGKVVDWSTVMEDWKRCTWRKLGNYITLNHRPTGLFVNQVVMFTFGLKYVIWDDTVWYSKGNKVFTIFRFIFHFDIASHTMVNIREPKIMQNTVIMCFKSFRFCRKIFEIYLQCTIVKIDRNRIVCKSIPPALRFGECLRCTFI